MGLASDNAANVACRCTVFTKSDMIHLQNKGERLEDIIYGLHVGNARNYMSTIVSNRALHDPILFVGGLSLNELQVRAFRDYYPNLIVPRYSTSLGALGVALQALDKNLKNRPSIGDYEKSKKEIGEDIPIGLRLNLKETDFPEDNSIKGNVFKQDTPVYLGVDIGQVWLTATEDLPLLKVELEKILAALEEQAD